MPVINIRLIPGGITSEQKAEVIKGVTDVMVNVLGKDPAKTFITIEEVSTDNWGVNGQQVTQMRAERAAAE